MENTERIEAALVEIKTMLQRYDERLRLIETREAGCAPIMVARIDTVWRRMDAFDVDLEKVKDDLVKIASIVKQFEAIMKWLLGIVTAVIASVAIALATGNLHVTFGP